MPVTRGQRIGVQILRYHSAVQHLACLALVEGRRPVESAAMVVFLLFILQRIERNTSYSFHRATSATISRLTLDVVHTP